MVLGYAPAPSRPFSSHRDIHCSRHTTSGEVNGVTAPQTTRRGTIFEPREIHAIEETGLSAQFLADLALKMIYNASSITGHEVAQRMRLPFVGVVDRILDALKRDSYIEVRGGSALSSASYVYSVTSRGSVRGVELLERSAYTGPAPVTLTDYWEAVEAQTIDDVVVNQRGVRD